MGFNFNCVSVPCSVFVVAIANIVFILRTEKAASNWGDSPVNKVLSIECEELSSDPGTQIKS